MSTPLARLKAATSLQDVAALLGFKTQALAYILYKKPSAAKYTIFDIPKRSGGVRIISAPFPALMLLQRRLADLLQDCIAEINKTRSIQSALSHGFRRKHSIMTNAAVHRRRRYVFNIDLENFFGAINFGRVRGFFIKNRNFELAPKVATVLAQIACHNNALPQGSPCSPVFSNLIGHILDVRLARLAEKVGCRYSRYADDLTFSTSKLEFPVEVAQPIPGVAHGWRPGTELERIIVRSGFSINASKTRMQYGRSRQDVTGLVVNTKINTRAEYRRTARAMVHRLLKMGNFQVRKISQDSNQNIVITEADGSLDQLDGILSFIDAVDHYDKTRRRKPGVHGDALGRVYRQFLFYKNFFAAPAPVIVCEGKTDNIYIRAAIRKLVADYPQLAQKNAAGDVSLKVRLFRYTPITKRILRLSGGTGELSVLIQNYSDLCDKIQTPGMQHPVVLVIDNDHGANGIFNVVKTVTKATTKPDGSKPFYYVTKNLYIVPIPGGPGKSSIIEDLFDASAKGIKLSGKSFNPGSKGLDRETEYGKYVFAEHVVQKYKDTIDFKGFKPLLASIESAIAAHNTASGAITSP